MRAICTRQEDEAAAALAKGKERDRHARWLERRLKEVCRHTHRCFLDSAHLPPRPKTAAAVWRAQAIDAQSVLPDGNGVHQRSAFSAGNGMASTQLRVLSSPKPTSAAASGRAFSYSLCLVPHAAGVLRGGKCGCAADGSHDRHPGSTAAGAGSASSLRTRGDEVKGT